MQQHEQQYQQEDQEEEEQQLQLKSMEENEQEQQKQQQKNKAKRKHPKSAVVRLPNTTLFLSKSLTSPQSLKNLSPLPSIPLKNRFRESFRGTSIIQRRPSIQQIRKQIKKQKIGAQEIESQSVDGVIIGDQDLKTPKSAVVTLQQNRAERKTILSHEKKQPLSLAQQVLTFSSVTQLQTGEDAVPSPIFQFHSKQNVEKKQKNSNVMRTGGGGQSTVVGLARLAREGTQNNFSDSQLSGNTRRKAQEKSPSQQKMKHAVGSLTPSEWRSARSRVMEPMHSNLPNNAFNYHPTTSNINKAKNKFYSPQNNNNIDIASQLPTMSPKSIDDNVNQTHDSNSKHIITSPTPNQNQADSRNYSPFSDKKQMMDQQQLQEHQQAQDGYKLQSNHNQFRPNRFKRFPRFTIVFKKQQNVYSSPLRNTVSDPQTQNQKFFTAALQQSKNLQNQRLNPFDFQSIKQLQPANVNQKKRTSILHGSRQAKKVSSKNQSTYQPQQAIYINLSPHIINQLVIQQQQQKQQLQTGQKTSNRSYNVSSKQLTILKGVNTFNKLQNISAHSLIQQQQQQQNASKQHFKSKQSQGTSPRWAVENHQSLPPIARQLTSGIQLAPDASKQLIATNKTPRLRSAGSAINFDTDSGQNAQGNKNSMGEFKNISSKNNTKRTADDFVQHSYDQQDQGFKMFDPFQRVLLTSSGGIDNAMITSTRTMQRLNNILSPYSFKIIHTNFAPKPISNFFKTSQRRSQVQQIGKRSQNRSHSPAKKYQVANVVQNIGYIAPLVVKQKQQINQNLSGYMSDVDYVSSTLRESIAMGHQSQAIWQAYLAARGSQQYSGAQSVDTRGVQRLMVSSLSAVKEEQERMTGDGGRIINQQIKAIEDNLITYEKGDNKNSPSFGARTLNGSQKQITLVQADIGTIHNVQSKNIHSKDDSTLENSKITMGPIHLSQDIDVRHSENFQNLAKNVPKGDIGDIDDQQQKYKTEVKHKIAQKMSTSKKKRKYYKTSMKTPPLHVGNIQVSECGLQSPINNQNAVANSERKANNNNNSNKNLLQTLQEPISPTPITKQKPQAPKKDQQQSNFYIHTVAKESVQSLSLNLHQSFDQQDKKPQLKINQSPLRIKMVTNKQMIQKRKLNTSQEDSLNMIGGLSKMQYAASKMATSAAKSLQKRQQLKVNLVRPFDISRRDSNQQNSSFNWNKNNYKLKPQASAPRVHNAFVPKVVPKFMKNSTSISRKPIAIKNTKQFRVTIRNQNQALNQIPDFQDNRRQIFKNRPSTTGKKSPPLNFKVQRDSGSIVGTVKRFSQAQPHADNAISQQIYLNNSSIGLSINNSVGQVANDSLSQGTGPAALLPRPMTVNLKSAEQSLYQNSNSLLDEGSIQDDLLHSKANNNNSKPLTRGMVKIRQQKGQIREIERDGASKAAEIYKDGGRRFVDYEKRASSPVGMRNQEFIWDKARMISFRKMSQVSRKSTVTIGMKKKSDGEIARRPNTGGGLGGKFRLNNSGMRNNLL